MIKKTDLCFSRFDELRNLLYFEHVHQIKKWGIQKRLSFEWLAYLTEEVGELAEAISCSEYINGDSKVYRDSDVVKEAVQVATLALKIVEMYLPKPKVNQKELFNKGFNK